MTFNAFSAVLSIELYHNHETLLDLYYYLSSIMSHHFPFYKLSIQHDAQHPMRGSINNCLMRG